MMLLFRLLITSHISQDSLYVPVTPGLVEHITNTTPSLHFPRAWERITPQTTMAAVVHAGLDQGTGHFTNSLTK